MQFTKLRFKNFLSFGNKFTTIDLNTNKATLITGENGSGKTATLEAFYFAMTGKPFRKIKKSELINTANKKELVVELEFTHEKNHYKIIRGIKPDTFEIYKNDQLIEQDAATKDYQQILENILGLDSKTLGQSIFISSKNYTPFLKLSASEKRNFIENVLDIKVFSQVLEQIKIKRTLHKESMQEIDYNIKSNQTNLELAIESNEKFTKNRVEQIEELKEKIEAEEQAVEDDDFEIKKINKWLKKQNFEDKRKEMQDKKESLETELENVISKMKSDSKESLDKLYDEQDKVSSKVDELKDHMNLHISKRENINIKIDNIIDNSKLEIAAKKRRLESTFHSESMIIDRDIHELDRTIKSNNDRISFFKENSVCPTCEQKISSTNNTIKEILKQLTQLNKDNQTKIAELKIQRENLKQKLDKDIVSNKIKIESEAEERIAQLDKEREEAENEISVSEKMLEVIQDKHSKINKQIKEHNDQLNNKIEKQMAGANQEIESVVQKITKIDKDCNLANDTINKRQNSINSCQKIIKSWQEQINKLESDKAELVDIEPIKLKIQNFEKEKEEAKYKKETIDMMIKMLGDNGLKSYIVKKYIPTLNELVNKFLEMFGANYRLSFDESFDINIHARGYEKLQYGSFSSGEEQRVDIALLFSFIELGKLKNSINCNAILLDEIADTSLDSVGLDGLFMMFEDMKRKNQTIFTISHRPELKDRFDDTYEVKKVNNFSQLTYV